MKKLFSLLIVALTATTSVFADDITVEQALQIAGQFANNPATQQLSKRRAPVAEITPMLAHTLKSKVADKDNAYVVNLGNNQGFVIVSGESGTGDNILGYCDHGSFSYEDCPVQLKDLLAFYTEAVDSLRQSSASASQESCPAMAQLHRCHRCRSLAHHHVGSGHTLQFTLS